MLALRRSEFPVASRRTRGALLLGGLFVVASCGQEQPASSDVGRACDLLATEAEMALAPPFGTRTMGLGEAIAQARPGPAFDAALYLQPTRSSELNEVAADVGQLEGIEVVAVMDQDDIHAEFLEIFAGNEQVTRSVTPEILPSAVRVTLSSDAEFEALEKTFSDDKRIYEIIDEYGLKADSIETIARTFPQQLAELEDIANGDLREAVAVIRAEERPSREAIPRTVAVIKDFLDRECDPSE